jgi:putative phosphoesterase
VIPRAARVAALSDPHGNLPALETAIAAARGARAELVVFGGDLAWGPMPAQTIAAVRALDLPALFVRGNADREVADPPVGDEIAAWCAGQVTEDDRAWLRDLPEAQVVEVDGLGAVRFCHGSPRSDEEGLTVATPAERVRAALAGATEPVIVCGHTHAQFDRRVGGTRLLNPGSVGLPFGAPGAHWALLGPEDVRFVVTGYDGEAAGALFRAAGGPDAADFAAHALAPPPARTAVELHG